MFSFFRSSVAESWALASIFALGFSLQALWVLALLIERLPAIATWMTFFSFAGPVSGLYICTTTIYLISLLLWERWYCGRDCSRERVHVVWFLTVSLLIFFIMSIPNIFQFTISLSL